MIEGLNRESGIVGLKIICSRQRKVSFNRLARKQECIIASQPRETVEEYVYLGELHIGDPDREKEI